MKPWRCPCSFLYCFLRLKWKTRILLSRPSADHGAEDLGGLRLEKRAGFGGEAENVGEFNLAVVGGREAFDIDQIAGRNPVLLTTSADDRVHNSSGAHDTDSPKAGGRDKNLSWAELLHSPTD